MKGRRGRGRREVEEEQRGGTERRKQGEMKGRRGRGRREVEVEEEVQ